MLVLLHALPLAQAGSLGRHREGRDGSCSRCNACNASLFYARLLVPSDNQQRRRSLPTSGYRCNLVETHPFGREAFSARRACTLSQRSCDMIAVVLPVIYVPLMTDLSNIDWI